MIDESDDNTIVCFLYRVAQNTSISGYKNERFKNKIYRSYYEAIINNTERDLIHNSETQQYISISCV